MNGAQTNAGGAQTLGSFGSEEEEDEEDEDGGNGVMVAEFDTLWGWGPSDFQLVFVRAADGTIHVFFVDHGLWGDHGAVYLGVYDPVSKIVTNDGNRQLMRDVVEKGSEGGDQDDWDDWFAKNPLTRGPTRGNMLNGTADANGGRPFEPLIHNPDPAHEDTARGWTDVAEGLAEFGVDWYGAGAGLATGTAVGLAVSGMGDDAARGAAGLRTWQEAGISADDALRIQNAANKSNQRIVVVGSRAAGTSHGLSDWDYILYGNSRQRSHVRNSVPRGISGGEIGASGRETGVDFWQGTNPLSRGYNPVNGDLPHVIFDPIR